MVSYERDGQPVAMRPTPTHPRYTMIGNLDGYLFFDEQEAGFTIQALEAAPDMWIIWYRTLNLFSRFFKRDLAFADVGDPENAVALRAWETQLRMAAAAIGAVKYGLDAALAGRYGQSDALTRYVLQVWERIEFLNYFPSFAPAWVRFRDVPTPTKPSDSRITASLESGPAKRDKQLKDALQTCKNIVSRMSNSGSHPGPESLWQTLTTPDHIHFAGTYDERLAKRVFSDGVWAALALALSLSRLAKFDPDWTTEYIETQNGYVLQTPDEAPSTNET